MKKFITMILVFSFTNFLMLGIFEAIESMYNTHILDWDWENNFIISVGSAVAVSFIVNFIDLWFWIGRKIGTV
ncbi:hypothetical protein PANI_CDS0046 [Maribacter phage Panino]